MDEAAQLERVKEVKRKAHFTYDFSRNLYLSRLSTAAVEQQHFFKEALQALDSMHSLYSMLKYRLRDEPLSSQIAIVKKWQLYMVCIETLLAAKTKDEELHLDDVLLPSAQEKAVTIFEEFQKQVTSRH